MITKVEEIERNIESQINSGVLNKGDQIPSLFSVSNENGVSRDTVVRAYKNLVARGLIKSIHGKGYFVSNLNTEIKQNILLLLDELSDYKNVLVKSIESQLKAEMQLRIFFHHYDEEVFKNTIEQSLGNFTHYVVSPFPTSEVVVKTLSQIPEEQLILLDRRDGQLETYKFVGQSYKKDIISCLNELRQELKKYEIFKFIFPEPSFHPEALKKGFATFCEEQGIVFEIYSKKQKQLTKKGEAYLVIDDKDLAFIVEEARESNLELGKDIGLISYNETRLKALIDKGITAISTDFKLMGNHLINMLLNKKKARTVYNSVQLIKRHSF